MPRRCLRFLLLASLLPYAALTQEAQGTPKERVRVVRQLSRGGSESIPRIEPYLTDPDLDVRLEAVKAIADIGTQRSLDALINASQSNDPEMQIRATDGLVNFYVPGYTRTGMTASVRRAGTAIKGRFTDTNDLAIDPYIQVRPGVTRALGHVARGGASLEARANAARAVGILRGRDAVPDLVATLRGKDSQVIYEALVALQKIGDESAGPSIRFLLRDLDQKVQLAAIETSGLLQDRGAINGLRDALDRARTPKIRKAALTAMAEMPDPQLRSVYLLYLTNKDEGLREAAIEGLGRLRNPPDLPTLQNTFSSENKAGPRLAAAFALVQLGTFDMTDFAPLRYLVNQLNSSGYRDVARAYLVELARQPEVRRALYPAFQGPVVTKDEKTGLAQVLSRSGDRESIPYLDTLSKDPDPDVAREGLRGARNLNARLP